MRIYLRIFLFSLITYFFTPGIAPAQEVTQQWTARFTQGTVSYGREIFTDHDGNVYVGGHSVLEFGGEGKTVFIKYDSTGEQLWEYQPDNTTDYMEDMDMDADGNIYWSGYRWTGSQFDFLTEKVNNDGDTVWTRIYDGIGHYWDRGIGTYVDMDGNVYTAGYAKGTFNGYDMTVVKYNSDGNLVWARQYANPDDAGQLSNYKNYGFNVYADADDNVYLSGYAFNGLSHELTLIKYNADGDQLWERDIDTHAEWSEVTHNFMRTDADGNIYMAGNMRTDTTGSDILLVKYNPSGDLLWSRTWDSDSDYVGGGYYPNTELELDHDGNIYITGTITTTPEVLFSEDIVTLKYNSDGDLLWEDIFNGALNDEDRPYGIVIDNAGNPYVTGATAVSATWGANDYFTYRLDKETGEHVWEMDYDGISSFFDEPHALCTDNDANIYITGWSATNADPLDLRADMVTVKYAPVIVNAIGEIHSLSGTLYPSPADQSVTIHIPGITGNKTVIVFDLTGRIIYTEAIDDEYMHINTSAFEEGLYQALVKQDGKSFTARFEVMHH